jgi:hypothetical protein
MSWKETWQTVFFPEFDSGGLSLTRDQVALRIYENAESPATTGTLSAAWTGTNVTVTRETTAPLAGEGSVKVAVAGGTGSVYKAFDRAMFGYPFPGHNGIRIRYVKFRATVSAGSHSFRLIFGDASDANHYRYWTFTVAQDKTVEWIADLDPNNTESNPAPVEGTTTWDPEQIDRFGFINMDSGVSYYFDDIEFVYEYSLVDSIGLPTEAPVDMGDVGSLHARINGLWANVKALEGRTWQFNKVGPEELEVGDEGVWGLELMSDFAPPATTEIEPGNYNIVRVRHGVSTTIVASTPASESAGLIYVTYQPQEDNWTEGDILKVQFTDGYVRSDEDPSNALTANASAGDWTATVPNAYEYQVGWLVRLYDSATPAGEYLTIASLTDATTIRFTTQVVGNYTTGNTATVTRAIRTDLDTALMLTRLVREAMIEFEGNSFFESDREDGAHTDALANVHWGKGTYKVGTGTHTAAITGGKIVVTQNTAVGDYAAKNLYSSKSKYFRVVVDLDATFTAVGASGATAGLAIVKGTAYDVNNNIEVKRYKDSTHNHINAFMTIGGAGIANIDVETTDDAVALMIERNDRTWRAWYSLTKFPDYEWVMIAEGDDAADAFGEQSSAFLYAETLDVTGDVSASFDNFKYIIDSKFLEQIYDKPAIVPVFDKQADPRVDQNTATGIEIFRVGLMDINNGLPTTAEITPGTTLVDRFREGTDTDWTNQAGETITNAEQNGYISALYDFPNATWKPGDQARFRLTGVKVTDAVTSRVYEVPDFSIYFVVGGPPNQNETQNLWLGDVNGSKNDAPDYTFDATTSSIIALLKGVLGVEVIEEGTLTTDSATIPADSTLGASYADNYFNGSWLMTIEGDRKFQPRLIVDYTGTTGVYTLDQEQPFTGLPGTSKYVLLSRNSQLVPAANGTNNSTPAHVTGNKADLADFTWDVATSTIVALVKGVLGVEVIEEGTLTTDSATVPADTTLGAAYEDNYFNGSWLMTVEGSRKFQPRLIVDFANTSGIMTLDPEQPFTGLPGASKYVILSRNSQLVPATDGTNNYTPAHVTGSKTDTPVPKVVATASIAAYTKGLVSRGMVVLQGRVTTGGSQTAISSTDLVGYGDDFFNNQYYMQVIQSDAAAPEPEVRKITNYTSLTGAFTCDAFSVNVEAGDEILLIHESLVAIGRNDADNVFDSSTVVANDDGSILERLEWIQSMAVIAKGTFTLSSTTVPEDNTRTTDENNYFNGSWLMPLTGDDILQPRLIVDWAIGTGVGGTGVFTIDPEQPFTSATGIVEYVVLAPNSQLVPAADGTNNYTPAHVIGNKTDKPVPKIAATASEVGYLKAAISRGMVLLQGICTTGASQTAISSTDLVGYGDGFFNDNYYLQILRDSAGGGAAPEHEVRKITAYTSTTGAFTCDAFSANVDAGDQLAIIHESLVAIGRNDANNTFDSSTVVADDDGSLLERAEYIQQQLGYGVRLLTETGGASTTLITATEITEAAGWWKNAIILGITGHNIGVTRPVISNTVGTITVYPALREANVVADTYLLISAYKPQVFEQQADTAVNLSLTQGAAATNVLSLAIAGYSYEVNQLVLKSADPTNGGATAQTVTITLYELINDVSTAIDTFTIDGTNFGTYFTLFDMFGQVKLTGDNLIVTAELSAGATTPIAVTGQYQHALIYTGAG